MLQIVMLKIIKSLSFKYQCTLRINMFKIADTPIAQPDCKEDYLNIIASISSYFKFKMTILQF